MKPVITKPVADPFDDIDRMAPVDSLMARQDRADLPGNRSDQPGNDENDPDRTELAADPDAGDDESVELDPDTVSLDELDPDLDLAMEQVAGPEGSGPDDDEPIEETERLGGDSLTS